MDPLWIVKLFYRFNPVKFVVTITIIFVLFKELSIKIEKLRKNLEIQIKDLQIRLDDAEGNALKGGKRIIQKLEQRVN